MIAVLGDANVDLTARIGRFPHEGDDCTVSSLGWGGGGMAVNVAVALARLGAPVRLLARVGVDPAATIALASARAHGVDLTFVQVDPDIPTGLCYAAISPHGERTFFAFRGANSHLTSDARALHDAHWLHITGHALIEGQQAETAWQALSAGNVPVSLDLCLPLIDTHRDALLRMLPLIDVLLLNETEAARLLPDTPETLIPNALLAHGARLVALKLGARGCVLARADEQVVQAGFAVDARDTNGSGDAFAAALIIALRAGRTLHTSAAWACAAGALVATRFGAAESLPTSAEIEQFIAQ